MIHLRTAVPFLGMLFFFLTIMPCLMVDSLTLVMMAARRRGKGDLKRSLDDSTISGTPLQTRSINRGKGQEITGVTLPADGRIKGWEFGEGVRMACANVNGRLYALQGVCPRCGFDLWKGDLIINDPGFEELPRIACPTCSTTYSLSSGKYGPPLKRSGLAAFVGNLAKTATVNDAGKNAKSYMISKDEDGRVYCRER
jgi:nitrite reductase/ring-hydroxylating ferredoxin subunit